MAENETEEKKMSLWEHLEDLRWMFFKIIMILALSTGLCLYFVDTLLAVMNAPLKSELLKSSKVVLNQTGPFDAVLIKMKAGLLGGIVSGLPFIVLCAWGFVRPGLKNKERKAFWWIYSSITVLFTAGIIGGYYLLVLMLPILVSFSVAGAENIWRLKDYIDFVFIWILGSGAIAQMPLVIYIVVYLNIVDITTLKKIRSYVFAGAFIASAIITPSTDIVSQIIVGLPLYMLYEAGIFAASFIKHRNDDIV